MASNPQQSSLPHTRYDELDGLRALSIAGVIIFHHIPVTGFWFSVNLFFVLSGFFITRNLQATREAPLGSYLSSFYVKRIARICPLYFLYLSGLALSYFAFGHPTLLGRYLSSLSTFTFNLTRPSFDWQFSEYFSHFWSLSVEMQFYMLWPWVLLLCPKRLLPSLLGVILIASPVYRYVWSEQLLSAGQPLNQIGDCLYWSTICHLDAFAAGALAAIFERTPTTLRRWWQRFGFGALILVGAANIIYLGLKWGVDGPLLASLGYPIHNPQALQHVWAGSVITLCWGTLVWRLLAPGEQNWWVSRILRLPLVADSGRVSYGMYVWHWLVIVLLNTAIDWPSGGLGLALRIVSCWIVVYGMAKLSYKWFEAPILARYARGR